MTETSARGLAPLTTSTRLVLAIARALAAAYGHENLMATHALLGILREGENPAVAVLTQAGISLDALRQDLERTPQPHGRPSARAVVIPVTEGERELLARADIERRRRDDRPLGTEHLLLALLHDATTSVSQLLSQHGLTYETAPAHIAAVIHYHPHPHDRHTG